MMWAVVWFSTTCKQPTVSTKHSITCTS